MEKSKSFFTIGTVLGETVNFYTDNFLKLWIPYIIILPVDLLLDYITAGFIATGGFAVLFISIINIIFTTVVSLYVTITALKLYKKSPVSYSLVMTDLKKIVIPYVLLRFVIYLGTVGGFLLLIVPGIIFTLRWIISNIVLVVEGTKIRESMKRSKILTKGFKGQILIVYLLLVIIAFVLMGIFTLMTSGIAGGFYGILMNFSAMGTNPLKFTSILYNIIASLLSPLYPVLAIIMYFSLMREKEGYVTEELADSFLEDETDK